VVHAVRVFRVDATSERKEQPLFGQSLVSAQAGGSAA
jgi:hypothetical protein